jgi:hypothetical protein
LFDDAGIDGLFSDFPDVCVAWLKQRGAGSSSAD